MPQDFGQRIVYPPENTCPNCKSTVDHRVYRFGKTEKANLHLRAGGWHCSVCEPDYLDSLVPHCDECHMEHDCHTATCSKVEPLDIPNPTD